MVDVTNIEASLNTTILGYDFANPFFISPAAKAQYGHPDAELNLMKGAGAGGIPYIVSLSFSSRHPKSKSKFYSPRNKNRSRATRPLPSRTSPPRRSPTRPSSARSTSP